MQCVPCELRCGVQRVRSVAVAKCRRERENWQHTSGNHPHTTFGDGELIRLGVVSGSSVLLNGWWANSHQNLALMYKEHHLHLAGVLGPLEAFCRQLDNSRAEEGKSHYLGILESRSSNVTSDDR